MAKASKAKKVSAPIARLPDGTELRIGDPVETDFHTSCAGVIFEIEAIEEFGLCQSGFIVLVHVQGHPERKLKGTELSTFKTPPGIDASWFKKI